MSAPHEARYAAWNNRIALFWFTKPSTSQDTYLTVTPSALALAYWECDGIQLAPEDAESDFAESVRALYRERVLERDDDVSCLARMESDTPLGLAFLALSVLAAHRMHDDAANRSTAYYIRLAQMLDAPVTRGELPKGLSKNGFEALWLYVRDWSQKHAGQRLFLPTAQVVRKYTAYPLAHVGLREVDLEKLPEFFDWAGYAPGASVAPERLRADLEAWAQAGTRLTRQGLAATADVRVEAVLEQVARELRAWDGVAGDAAGRRVAHVELTLDVLRGVPRLAYLARRPPGFPEIFEYGQHRLDSLDEGWYDPAPVQRSDGTQLLHGFQWESQQRSPTFVLRRAAARVIAFVRSQDYSGLTSRRRLLAGIECALLFHDSVSSTVRARIAQLVSHPPLPVSDPNLPDGWHLVLGIRAARPTSEALPGLEALEVDAAVEIATMGGLRLGRRAEWLVDSPPKIVVSGEHVAVRVNGRPTPIGADGIVEWSPQGLAPGTYVIEAGRTLRRISLVEARVASDLPVLGGSDHREDYPVALARGRWVLLGVKPGEIAHSDLKAPAIVRLRFDPAWGIRMATPGTVVFLRTDSGVCQPEDTPTLDADTFAWAKTIESAVSRNMPVAALSHVACVPASKSWPEFRRVAQRLLTRRHEREAP